jgi:hypothetical protein
VEAVHCCESQRRVLRVGWRLDTNTALPGSGLLALVSVVFGREPAEASAVVAVAYGPVAGKAEAEAEVVVAEMGAVVAVHLEAEASAFPATGPYATATTADASAGSLPNPTDTSASSPLPGNAVFVYKCQPTLKTLFCDPQQ